jgi:UDP-2,4-diacetamido-2,4,6-trideoxy-beta-L-altropyranose hydrolase
MQILFRVDASQQIGSGHFVRCLSLAAALRGHGATCTFLCRRVPAAYASMLHAYGIQLVHLPAEGTNASGAVHPWLGVSQEHDVEESLSLLGEARFDWLIVDHYALDARWERRFRHSAKAIMVIDDLADRQHDCDVLLDQNLYAEGQARYVGRVPEACRILIGPRFALLRHEFAEARVHARARSGEVRKILVFFGGTDIDAHTVVAVEALQRLRLRDVAVDVVIGAEHPRRTDLEAACATYGFVLHVQTTRMASLMLSADLAIGAGGSATWERCCLGLPSIVFATAENQRKLVREAALAGIIYSPDVEPSDGVAIQMHVRALLDNSLLQASMSVRGMATADGIGTQRVVRALGLANVTVRSASIEDARDVFAWRNQESVRSVSRNSQMLDWEAHKSWFDAVLRDSAKHLLIGERAGLPIGVVRFDTMGADAEVSIYMVAEHSGKGLGAELLLVAEAWLLQRSPVTGRLIAEVLDDNLASHNLFSRAGYRRNSVRYSKRLH